MNVLEGPGAPFTLLFNDAPSQTPSLPDTLLNIYPGDWHVPTIEGRPYVYSNLAISRDGRISFNEPGALGAEPVTLAAPHDRWIMALLRLRADAVMSGDNTLKLEDYRNYPVESGCFWSAEAIYPPDAAGFAAQRQADGRPPFPLLVVLSLDGDMDLTAPFFNMPDCHTVFATTAAGAEKARSYGQPAQADILPLGDDVVDLSRLVDVLHRDYGVRHLLCEGGAGLQANMLDAGLIDEEFVTWCPTFVGQSADHRRPSYVEGVAWMPGQSPYSKPLTLHRGGDYLFLRTRCQYTTKERS